MRDKLEFLGPILLFVAAVLDLIAGIKNDEKYLIIAGICFFISSAGMFGSRISKRCMAKTNENKEESQNER